MCQLVARGEQGRHTNSPTQPFVWPTLRPTLSPCIKDAKTMPTLYVETTNNSMKLFRMVLLNV